MASMHPVLLLGAVIFLISGATGQADVRALAPAPYLSLFSPEGQSRWTGLCKNGQQQSPVGLNTSAERAPVPNAVELNYSSAAHIRVSNEDNGGPQLNVEPGSTAILTLADNNTYTLDLKQIHWHHPGEHTLDNKHFDIETHLVHTIRETGKYAVFAVVLESAENAVPDPVLRLALKYAPTTYTIANDTKRIWGDAESPDMLDLEQIYGPVMAGSFGYYQGSLTTPPCTEGINWFIFLTYGSVAEDQLTRYVNYVQAGNSPDGANENDRPLQALHGRVIQYIQQQDASTA